MASFHVATLTATYLASKVSNLLTTISLCLSKGLHLFAEGLSDFRDALIQCNETDIVKILTKFVEDLVSCTEGK